MFRVVETDPGTIRETSPQHGKLRMGGEIDHAADVSGGRTGRCPQVRVAGRAGAIGNRSESIRALMLVVTAQAIRRIWANFLAMVDESLVASDAGLVQGQVGKLLVGGDQALNRLPWSAVTVSAVESLVDLDDRCGGMDVMRAEPYIICHPTERGDHSDDESDDRGACGNR